MTGDGNVLDGKTCAAQAEAGHLVRKVPFALATLLIVLGATLRGAIILHARPAPAAIRGPADLQPGRGPAAPSRAATRGGAPGPTALPVGEVASPILIESGMAFFVGYCLGCALTAVTRVVAVVGGVSLIAVAGLESAGVLPPIPWDGLSEALRATSATVQGWIGHVEATLSHGVPSGAMAALGLGMGFRRR